MDPGLILILAGVAVVALVLALVFLIRRGKPGGTTPPPGGWASGMLGQALRRVWGGGVDATTWERLEDELIGGDVGVESTHRIVGGVRARAPGTLEEAREALTAGILAELARGDRSLRLVGKPAVILVVGVNGSGKTTSIAKLASRLRSQGRSVVLAAADTFRAAAAEQLGVWGERLGVPVVAGQEGGDPAAVVHDALTSARANGTDVVIVDTAGRLHSRRNLMDELAKVHRVAGGEGGVDEVLLVLDATGGQNGLAQVREFAGTIPVTGLILAKMDGTARGGVVIAVEDQLGVPVKLVGTGEGVADLAVFDPVVYVASLLGE